MKRKDRGRFEAEDSFYPVFSGYQVKTKKKKVNPEQHYIVPWEMIEDKRKKFVY